MLRDILLEDEADAWALEELTKLRELADDHAEVVKLLLRRAELAGDGAQIVELKKRAADVLEQKLGGDVQAITLYEEIFEQEPGDFLATTKLRALYEKTARTRELGKLLERLIDMAETPGARSTLRLDLARLEETAFQSPAQAATTLRAILEEEPGHTDAVLALSQLLERTGQDEELADLLNEQIELARGRNDEPGELALRIRLGEVFEGRLKDTTRALASFQQVLGEGAFASEGARGGRASGGVEVRLGAGQHRPHEARRAGDRPAWRPRCAPARVRARSLRGQRRDPASPPASPGARPAK